MHRHNMLANSMLHDFITSFTLGEMAQKVL